MKQLNLAIIVPFYNESKNLVYFINEWENLLSSKKQIRDSLFFFFVNDGSTDDSVKNIKKKIKKLNYYIVNKRNSGHGDSCRFGYSFVANNYKKFNYVMQIDSDNQCDPKYLIQFYNLIKINKEDFVFGYRKFREDGYSRLLISRLLAITTFIKKFIYVKDLNTPYRLMKTSKLKQTLINIGTGVDFSINYYAKFISEVILKKKIFIKYDKSKPNGVSRKLMDISLAKNYGWEPKINLEESILKTYKSYLSEKKKWKKL